MNGSWIKVEPKQGAVLDDYELNGRQFTEVGKGLDFSEVYIKTENGYNEKPVSFQSLEIIPAFRPRLRRSL